VSATESPKFPDSPKKNYFFIQAKVSRYTNVVTHSRDHSPRFSSLRQPRSGAEMAALHLLLYKSDVPCSCPVFAASASCPARSSVISCFCLGMSSLCLLSVTRIPPCAPGCGAIRSSLGWHAPHRWLPTQHRAQVTHEQWRKGGWDGKRDLTRRRAASPHNCCIRSTSWQKGFILLDALLDVLHPSAAG